MGLQILLSAMFLKDENYIDTLNIKSDCVIINQCDTETKRVADHTCPDGRIVKATYIETKERGLSKSRNMAIANADADICILCDNDVEYCDGYEDMILSSFAEHPEADLIVFYIKRPERLQPNYSVVKKMGYLSVLKIFSPEIAFRKKSISDVSFMEEFGAGARYIMGEENIFLYDCLKKRKTILYVPKQIASLREEESTWFKGYGQEFFVSRGANYAAMSRMFSHLLIWQFALRKRALYGGNMTMWSAIRMMYKGRREFLTEHR